MEAIAIFAALQWECRAVLRRLRQVERRQLGALTLWVGRTPAAREVWLMRTGMGTERAAAAAREALGAQAFDLIVSTGCAGGLAPELAPGDLVVASGIAFDPQSYTPTAESARGHVFATDVATRAGAMRAAADAGLRCAEGAIWCSATVLATAADKRAAAARGLIAVEMEGAAIADCAVGARRPFLSVRSILDGVDHELHIGGQFTDPSSGNLKAATLAAYLATHPGALPELLALQRMQRAAEQSLAMFFARWLDAQ